MPVFITLIHISIRFWDFAILDFSKYTSLSVDQVLGYLRELAPTQYTWTMLLAWIALQVFLYYFVPGKIAKGLPDPDTGIVLQYPINGWFAFLFSVFGTVAAYTGGVFSPSDIFDNYGRFAVTSMAFSFILAIFLYVKSFSAEHQNSSGSAIYDFFVGRERNPRLGWLDLKYFFECRPGLIGWACLSVIACLAQYEKRGSLHPALAVTTLLHLLYVGDCFYFEESILSTLDIVYDEFGWMLAFGDMAYVPYLYPLSAVYLINHTPDSWPSWIFLAILGLGLFAYYAFRASNAERDAFKTGRLKGAKSIRMIRFDGSQTDYLVSGWSALARRPNYWPDLLNSISYSLPTGFSSVIAWIYPLLFLVLLSHRQHRLEEKGRLTYKNWQDFVKAVPYRMIPFVF